MALQQVSGPAVEPISVAEAKEHMRVDGTSEDALISSLILTSRLHIEAALGLALITQSWRLLLDAWPKAGEVRIPLRPLQSVSEIKTYDAADAASVVATDRYVFDAASNPGRIVPGGGGLPQLGRAANGIEISFVAGYGDNPTDVPAPIRQALLLLIAHWYEHRDPVEIGTPGVAIPASVSRLLKPYRQARL